MGGIEKPEMTEEVDYKIVILLQIYFTTQDALILFLGMAVCLSVPFGDFGKITFHSSVDQL